MMKSGQLIEPTEEALQKYLKEASDYKYALEQSFIVAITDEKGVINYANDNFCKTSKYSREELTGQDHRIISSDFHPQEFIRNIWIPIANGKIWRGELKNKAKDGTYYWVDTTIVPFLNEEGNPYQYVTISVDVTEQKKAEENLEKKLKEVSDYKFALDESSIVAITDETGIIKYANHNFSKISKYSVDELTGESHLIIHPEFHTVEFISNLWDTVAKGKIWRGELMSKAKDGSIYWVDTSIVPFINEQGRPYQYVVIRTDITARKLVEEELQIAHERLLFHIENTPLGFIEWDNQLHIKSLSKRAEEIFGWSLKEFSENERSGYSQVYKEDLPIAGKMVDDLINGLVERNTIQHRNITKNGKVIWCEWFNSALKDKDGKVVTIMSLVKDITESKQVEKNLLQSEARLKEAQSLSHISNWEVDLLTNIHIWSDEFYTIFGIKREDILPSSEAFFALLHPEDISHSREIIEASFKNLEGSSFYSRTNTKEGSAMYVYCEWRFEFNKSKNPVRLFGIIQDVTERKLAETERTKIVNDLIQRNEELEQFAYIVSHNLRGPVVNILGAASGLNDPELSTQEKYILSQGLNESVTRLDNVVKDLNHILQVKREINETKEKVCFSGLVDDIKISIKNLIDTDNVEIKYDFSEIDEFVTLKSYLHSIFYNLISNSIKYRQQQLPAIIDIKSHQVKDKIELIFTDNGMGIDLQKRGGQVFGLYKRFHTNIEGKGMGLFMVKKQVETLGGKISIKSGVNAGTEFKIEFEK